MSTTKKILLALVAASMLLALVAGSAAALRSINVSQRQITLLAENLTFEGAGVQVICNVGMTINTPDSIAKRPTNPIGTAEVKVLRQEPRNATEECRQGRALVLLTERPLPYTINYLSFEGTLPTITGIQFELLRVLFQIERLGQVCLVTADVLGTQKVDASGNLEVLRGEPREDRFRLNNVVVRRISGIACPTAAETKMIGRFRPVGGPIRIRLV